MSLRGGDPAEIGGYPLEARLGSGGMGTVFLARTSSGRPVAIKLIHQQFAGDDEFRIRFRQEVAAARRVSGAFTAAVVDAAPEAEQPWMATTYIEGPTLAQYIARKGPLDGAELRRLAIGLAEALRDIHRVGVVHRDLKPSNVVLSPEGPRVIDFGISRAVDQQTLTMTGRVIGTPPFMSPEQLQAPRGVGPRSDVFSLGTLLVYSATGRGPFDADSPYMSAYQVVHEEPTLDAVPVALRAVVEPCLDKEPEGRPSADELLMLLRDLPADLGGTGSAGSGAGRTRDVVTQHDVATPPTPTPVPAGPDTDPAVPGAGSTGTSIGRGLRRRWRPVLAAAVAVAAIGGGAAVLKTGGLGEDDGGDKAGTVAAPAAALPEGFAPWRETVPGGREDLSDELRCVARGEALFCGGGGVVATRVSALDGSRVWTAKSPGVPVQGTYLVGATDDTVLGYRFAAEDAPQDPSSEVVAIDADTGRELWSVPSGAWSTAVTGRTQDAVVAGSAVVTVDASNSSFEARDAHSGEVTWTRPFPGDTRCAPVLAGPRLFAMCAPDAELDASEVRHPTLYTVDRASGELGEPIEVDGPAVPMGVADGRLVLLQEHREGPATTGYDGVARVDPASRKVTYSRLAKTYEGTPGMADGTVYVSGQTGLVTALDPATGRKKWSRQTGVEGASGPAEGADALYFSSASGRVVALSPQDGTPLWATNPQADGLTGDQGTSPRVTVAGRVVVAAAAENTLFAFDALKPPKAG
ncbi:MULTISPECIES: serine/threonine-protein kinase [unclassified Streptomyces]|uniref:serine/threonine-protein kinase n=1 Tax=unclassified Streptomyces TaxID=2593676 RepID=UPI00081BB54F|nr:MULTISPECIES: serine/threonine-protein kinase [unclassified Streptomyces]MYQ53129.1 PQQ-binding-like beta-propeller repeat protein [Streptomyces sp. SID4941]SCD98513.1 Serine/threonine protein kinase [Streptomyces sp. PalvLS-984]SDC24440.1 Serine/threonine protein kinase [Streptomyces sp. AmelKG-A3]